MTCAFVCRFGQEAEPAGSRDANQVDWYCCGGYGHLKVVCPFKEMTCTCWQKTDHLRSICRDAPKEAWPKDCKNVKKMET